MASAKAWGTITIVDTTDIGQFSVTPSSNKATVVIYTPDDDVWSQNWASSNAIITPVIYYGGSELTPGVTPNLTVTWSYKTNSDSSYDSLPSWARPQTNGTLKLTSNPFTDSSIGTISFKCTSTYNEPATGLLLTAAGEITYSAIRHAASVPFCRISGENVFKYNTSQTIVGTSSITLTVSNAHCSITKWQYKNGNAWTDITTTASTLTVTPDSNYFVNGVATLKVVTDVTGLYDIHTITKIYDGAAGQSTLAAILTNEDQIIPCDKNGNPINNAFLDASTQLIIYRGGEDETNLWQIGISSTGGVEYQKSTDGTNWVSSSTAGVNYSYIKVTAMTGDVGSVTFTAQKGNETQLVKKFSLSKVKTGADGADAVSYILELSSNIVHADANNNITSGSITAYLYSRSGAANRQPYSGRLRAIAKNGDVLWTGTSDKTAIEFASSGAVLPNVVSDGSARIEMYASGSTTTLLDMQSITLVKDGAKGEDGEQGEDGTSPINVVLGNYSDAISCNVSNVILPTTSSKILTIPFVAYEGINRVACTTNASDIIITYASGKTVTPVVTPASSSSDGTIVYTFPKGATISDTYANISVAINFTVTRLNGTTVNVLVNYTIARVSTGAKGASGASAYYGYVETPDGTVFNNGTGTLSLEAHFLIGATDHTETDSTTHNHTLYKWYKRTADTWTRINEDIFGSNTVDIDADDVSGIGWYKCEIYYTSTTSTVQETTTLRSTLYATLMDKTDPIQAQVLSTAGDKFVNGIAEGALYVKVYRNGVEIDPLPTEVISKTAPTSPSEGDMYFKIDKTNKSIKLMKYVSGDWVEQTYSHSSSISYTWHYRDRDGEAIQPIGMATSGKIIYVDGDFVTVKLSGDCEVTVTNETS